MLSTLLGIRKRTSSPNEAKNRCSGRAHPHTRPLNELPLGTPAVVESVRGSQELRRRLLEMGFCTRAGVTAVRRAPFGDPIEFLLRGYHISLREVEANCILVVPHADGMTAPLLGATK